MDNEKKSNPVYSKTDTNKVVLKDEEWKKMLSPEVYYIARQKGTERPFTSQFENFRDRKNLSRSAGKIFNDSFPVYRISRCILFWLVI